MHVFWNLSANYMQISNKHIIIGQNPLLIHHLYLGHRWTFGGEIIPNFEKNLSYIILGQKGGKNRLQIMELLNDRPYNLHQLAQVLNLNYRTIEHHINVLTKHELITTSESKGYGNIYYLTPEMEGNIALLDDIRNKVNIFEKLLDAASLPQFFQDIVEQTNDAVIITDKDLNVLLWNRNAENMFGYKKEEILGSSIQMLSDTNIQKNILKKLEKGKEVGIIETQVTDKDARSVDVELSANIIRKKDEVIGFSFFYRDISKRKKANEELAAIFYLSPNLISVFDDTNFIKVNPTWEKQMGWEPKDLLSKSMMDFIHKEDVEMTKNSLAKLDKRDVVYFENRFRKKGGRYRWLSWSASKWLHGGIYGIARDISDYKEKADKKGR
jgi:PAS domain S-box-containing protein